MNKAEIKKQINLLYKETIAHNELTPEFKIVMRNFKQRILDYILSIQKKKNDRS